MSKQVRRVVTASSVIVAIIAAAVLVTIWRYQSALSSLSNASTATGTAHAATRLEATFADERLLMLRYIARAEPAALRHVRADEARFAQLSGQLTPQAAVEKRAIAQAAGGHARYYRAFQQATSALHASPSRKFMVLGQLDQRAAAVIPPLRAVGRIEQQQAAAARAAAAQAADQALVVGIVSAVLAVLAGTAFGIYIARLLRGGERRTDDLVETLGRLSDRNALLARLRTTSSVLGGVAGELRTAAGEAAAATSQQSAAVTQTSATIEELAVTAGTIADNVRAVSQAAGQTGETMADMRAKVEAIAERAQSACAGWSGLRAGRRSPSGRAPPAKQARQPGSKPSRPPWRCSWLSASPGTWPGSSAGGTAGSGNCRRPWGGWGTGTSCWRGCARQRRCWAGWRGS